MKSVLFLSCFLSILCTSDLQAAAKLGEITKNCETSLRKEHYEKILTQVNILRKDQKKFDNWYKNTYERAFGKPGTAGLNTLRDLGTYHPDPAKNQQKNITTAADARKKGTPLQKLSPTATNEQFAEQLSLVHPSNNTVFTAVMKCVNKARNAKEDIVENVPTAVPAATESEVDALLEDVAQPSTPPAHVDDLDNLLGADDLDLGIDLDGTLIPVS